MIKANVILENINWKKKIKDPNTYIKKRLKVLSTKKYFRKKKKIFNI